MAMIELVPLRKTIAETKIVDADAWSSHEIFCSIFTCCGKQGCTIIDRNNSEICVHNNGLEIKFARVEEVITISTSMGA